MMTLLTFLAVTTSLTLAFPQYMAFPFAPPQPGFGGPGPQQGGPPQQGPPQHGPPQQGPPQQGPPPAQHQARPPPPQDGEYAHKDADKTQAFKGSSIKGDAARADSAFAFQQGEANAAQGSKALFNALRAKSKGASSSKGQKFAQKETVAEDWDDKHVWEESMEVVDSKQAQASQGNAKETAAMERNSAGANKLEAKEVEAVNESHVHTESGKN